MVVTVDCNLCTTMRSGLVSTLWPNLGYWFNAGTGESGGSGGNLRIVVALKAAREGQGF